MRGKQCFFQKFLCKYCNISYYHFEHYSEECPEKNTLCKHCNKTFKLKDIPSHDCNLLINTKNYIIQSSSNIVNFIDTNKYMFIPIALLFIGKFAINQKIDLL